MSAQNTPLTHEVKSEALRRRLGGSSSRQRQEPGWGARRTSVSVGDGICNLRTMVELVYESDVPDHPDNAGEHG